MRKGLIFFAALSGALVLFSCSLRPFAPALGLKASPAQMRDLSELTYFAIAVSEGVSNSLSSANVGNRSLICLNAVGQVFFPYTLSQLTTGVSVSIPGGTHGFTILGFNGVTGSPATVAQLFSGSASLKAYVVAQKSVNTLETTSVQMQSTYVSGVTSDLVVACPPASIARHALYNVSAFASYIKNAGTWTTTTVDSASSASLFVDSQGVAHASVSNTVLR